MEISGKKIAELRKKKGLSRAALSRCSGISIRTLEDWEAGRRKPRDIDKVYKLCKTMDISIEEIMSTESLNNLALENASRIFDESEDEIMLVQRIEAIYAEHGLQGILKLLDRFIHHAGVATSLEIIREYIDESHQA